MRPAARRTAFFFFVAAPLLVGTGCRHTKGADVPPRAQAQAHLEAGRPKQAVAILEELHRAAPHDFEIARALVGAHAKAYSLDLLTTRLEELTAARPTAMGHYMLGLAYFARAKDAGAPAARELEKAISLAPAEPELHLRLGIAYLESEDYPSALGPLKTAAALAPSRGAVHLPLAKALAKTDDRKGAVAALHQVLRLAPTPAEVATAKSLMAELADPFARFPQAARPKLEEGLHWLQAMDVPQQAIIAFEDILRDFPGLAVVHALLGLAYQRLDDAGRALEELRKAIELDPDSGMNRLYLGELYLARQRPEQAFEALGQAIERHPLLEVAYLRRGELALDRRDPKTAREMFERLCVLSPNQPAFQGHLAAALLLEDDLAGAERIYREVLARRPEDLEFQLRLALVYVEKRRRLAAGPDRKAAELEATKLLRQVLRSQPDNVLASAALEGLQAK